MAQNGQLTVPQQAELNQFAQGEKNTAAQTYASMGRNINQDTSGISTQQNIDASINAMAQKEIATTIQLGLGELSAGGSMTGQALGFENAANQALIQAGQAQIQQDKDYSTALTGAFSSIADDTWQRWQIGDGIKMRTKSAAQGKDFKSQKGVCALFVVIVVLRISPNSMLSAKDYT